MALVRDTTNVPATNPFTSALNFTTIRTTGAFTPQANSALFIVVGAAGNTGTPTATVTDNHGNTFTLLKSNATATTNLIGVYWHYYVTSPGSTTISAQTTNTAAGGMIEVINYLGAHQTQNGNTVAVNRSSAGTIQGALTVGTGNIAIGGGTNFSGSANLTELANSTLAGHFSDTTNADSYAAFLSTTTGANTYGYSTSTDGGFAAAEIKAAAATNNGAGFLAAAGL